MKIKTKLNFNKSSLKKTEVTQSNAALGGLQDSYWSETSETLRD
jgi:hypothetical protein